MTKKPLTRREFLTLSGMSALSLAFVNPDPHLDLFASPRMGRVANQSITLRAKPSFQAERIGIKKRNDLLTIYEEIIVPFGKTYNPRWYRIYDGYVHSAYVQPVEAKSNRTVWDIPPVGIMAEVTMPYTQSLRYFRSSGWEPLYTLYYESLHWLTGIVEGPDGTPWYQITDDLHRHKYYVRSNHMRILAEDEYSPLSPDVPPEEKSVWITLADQKISCYEGDRLVFQTPGATGVGGPTTNDIPRDTPVGNFRIGWKMPIRHMGYGELNSDPNAYELPGVPWCCFFVSTGVAFHGTYWHDNFGYMMSSGCVNMKTPDALWLYRWTTPTTAPGEWYTEGAGTRVFVREF